MIYKRYGTSYQSVDIDFDAKALNDIGFRRNHESKISAEGFEDAYATIETVELTADAQGAVQTETKQALLDHLREKVEALAHRLPEGGIMIVDNEPGHDYPKTRQITKNVVRDGENRLHFEYSMSPPLRVTLYRPEG